MSEPLPSWRARQGVYLLVGHGSLLTPVDSLARLSLAEVPDRVLVRLAPFVVETQAVRSVVRRARALLPVGGSRFEPDGEQG